MRRVGLFFAVATIFISAKLASALDTLPPVQDIPARYWLELLDSGNYEKGWNQANRLFKEHIALPAWKGEAMAVRDPLGKVISRNVIDMAKSDSLPGLPNGHYSVVRFKTVFANGGVTETVTVGGDWNVVRYSVN
jgi:hypothetical protein